MNSYTIRQEGNEIIVTLGPGTWPIREVNTLLECLIADKPGMSARYEMSSHVILQGESLRPHTTIRLKKNRDE